MACLANNHKIDLHSRGHSILAFSHKNKNREGWGDKVPTAFYAIHKKTMFQLDLNHYPYARHLYIYKIRYRALLRIGSTSYCNNPNNYFSQVPSSLFAGCLKSLRARKTKVDVEADARPKAETSSE
jgi:hypothetical protein